MVTTEEIDALIYRLERFQIDGSDESCAMVLSADTDAPFEAAALLRKLAEERDAP